MHKTKLAIFFTVISFALFGVAEVASAAPIVTGVMGDLTNGASVTVVGSGFGTKTTATPTLWDTVDNQSAYSGLNDGDIVPVGAGKPWGLNESSALVFNETDTQRHSNSTATYKAINNTKGLVGYKSINPATQYIYVSWWWKPGTDPLTNKDFHSSKFIRLSNSSDFVNQTFSWTQSQSIVYRTDTGYCGVDWTGFPTGTTNNWNFMEVWINATNRTWTTRVNGQTITNQKSWGACAAFNFDYIWKIGWDAGGTSPLAMTTWMDDIYVDSTFSRVMIGNASTYASSTHFEMQIPSAWSDSSVTVTLNQGSLDALEGKYLYVIDADGNVNADGYLLSSAAPAVTGISGTLANGSAVTITGTGFGVNGPTIKLYDEFESGTIGNVISLTAGSATINKWSASNGSGLTTYSNEWSHSGTKSMKNNWDTPSAEPGNQMLLDFSDATEIFYSFWTMIPSGKLLPGDPAGGGPVINWKFSWLWGGNFGNTHANEYFSPAIPNQQFGSVYTLWFSYNTSQGRVTGGERGDHMTKGEWSRIDHYVKGGVTDGILHAVETDATHGIVTKVNQTNVFTLENGYAWNHLTIPGYGKGQTTNGVTVHDDVYVATGPGARARVEIGDTATYATSKNLSIATVTSWGDTSITATLRQGSFTNFNNTYLYVIDADGNVNTNGYPLSGGADTTPPSAPQGLVVN